LVAGTEGSGEETGIGLASQGFSISTKQCDGLLRCFIQELQTEVSKASGEKLG